MKKSCFLALMLLTTVVAFSQTPNQFKYQAVLRDAGGNVLVNQNVNIVISILQSDLSTSVFYETHNTTTTEQGLINLNVGSVEDMSGVDWNADEYFIEISVNGTVMGTSQLLSVPYALHAKIAENVFSGDYDDLINRPFVPVDLSELTDNSNLLFDSDYNSLSNLPTLFSENYNDLLNLPTLFSGSYIDLTNTPDFTNWDTDVSDDFSGDYTDLFNKPVIPVDLSELTDNSNLLFDSDYNSLSNLPTLFSENYNDLLNLPTLFSGSYIDLTNTPDFTNWDTDASDDFSGSYNNLTNIPVNIDIDKTDDITLATPATGDMLYYNGTAWLAIPQGTSGQVLTMSVSGIPSWETQNISNSFNPIYPDGLSNITPFTLKSLLTSTYTVPDGKNLYITNIMSIQLVYDILINGITIFKGGSNSESCPNLSQPIILSEGDILSSSSNEISLNGFVVDKTVTVLTKDNLLTTNYTVPAGKLLYITNLYTGVSGAWFYVNNVPIYRGTVNSYYEISLAQPIIVIEGEVISAQDDAFTFNGYLVDK